MLVAVVTGDGYALLLERTEPPGYWQSVTGSLKWDESPRRAAERELYEETGLRSAGRLTDLHRHRVFRIVPPWQSRYAPGVLFNVEHQFVLRLSRRALIRLEPGAHRQYRWMPATQALRIATSPNDRQLLARLSNHVFDLS